MCRRDPVYREGEWGWIVPLLITFYLWYIA